jgi:hypothetical protein
MIRVTRSVPVNEPGMPHLSRSDVFAGLVLKANDAVPFAPAITSCNIIDRRSPQEFVREIEVDGEKIRELVTLEPETRVTFERLSGKVLGTIFNVIEGDDEADLRLRFLFDLSLEGAEPGSAEEQAYAQTVESSYLQALASTLRVIRTRFARST